MAVCLQLQYLESTQFKMVASANGPYFYIQYIELKFTLSSNKSLNLLFKKK